MLARSKQPHHCHQEENWRHNSNANDNWNTGVVIGQGLGGND